MDRRNNCNHINRNTSNISNIFKSRVVRSNLVTPEIFVSEVWRQDDAKNGVEIIELNSSNSEVSETTQTAHNFSEAWGFVNRDRFIDTEGFRVNELARERWRKKNEEKCAYPSKFHDTETNGNGFHYIDNSISTNYLTILNNHIVQSDSSSDNEYAIVEEIEPYLTENSNDDKYWNHVYKDDVVKYEPINLEQRTVWIYSFKNKRRLSENDFELVNIPSTDTSSPISDEDNNEEGSNVRRIASPIPATFIPRLDLSLAQTLSTVTEISEVKNSEQSSKESLVTKPVSQPINNWFTERNYKKTKTHASDVVNWMALSPRERRRWIKYSSDDAEKRTDIFTHAEGIIYDLSKEKIAKSPSAVILVDVEIHANDKPAKLVYNESINSEKTEEIKVEKKKVVPTLSIDILYADADTEIENDKGDFSIDTFTKPSIQLTPNKTYDIITEPIEKLNSTQWIIEEEKEKEISDVEYAIRADENSYRSVDEVDSASKRLWMNNAKLLKSPMWSEYLPIARTPPASHLSLSLSSIGVKKPWYQRISQYLRCCK